MTDYRAEIDRRLPIFDYSLPYDDQMFYHFSPCGKPMFMLEATGHTFVDGDSVWHLCQPTLCGGFYLVHDVRRRSIELGTACMGCALADAANMQRRQDYDSPPACPQITY